MFRILLAFVGLSLALPLFAGDPPKKKYQSIERLALERLAATHADVEAIQKSRKPIDPLPDVTDFRCIMHAHAEDSTHTGGTLPEMLADAKKVDVNAILLTDHYRPPRDFIDGRWRGIKDGVLFIPGSETRGFLAYPVASVLKQMEASPKDFIAAVTADRGMIFLSHLEERKDHPVDGLTGMEIYNRHYDVIRDPASLLGLIAMLTDEKQLADLHEARRLYHAEMLAFQCDYPSLYLKKWDEGQLKRRLTGVAANDCHHNMILQVKMVDENTVLIGTNVDEDKSMKKVTSTLRPGIKAMTKGHKPGDILTKLDLDPYARSFLNSSTHILAKKLEEGSIRDALHAGHAYVAHDWICDPKGFQFLAESSNLERVGIMGDDVTLIKGLQLKANLTAPAYIRLMRAGVEVAKWDSAASIAFPVEKAGAYRLEAWMKLDGEYRPWIYSNPIYVRESKANPTGTASK
ncbi:MAG: hypothetical protein U0798_21125 [Gemmataceae bacterium]